jgi:hypothetical protein
MGPTTLFRSFSMLSMVVADAGSDRADKEFADNQHCCRHVGNGSYAGGITENQENALRQDLQRGIRSNSRLDVCCNIRDVMLVVMSTTIYKTMQLIFRNVPFLLRNCTALQDTKAGSNRGRNRQSCCWLSWQSTLEL